MESPLIACDFSQLNPDEIEFLCGCIPTKEVRLYFQKYSKDFAKICPGHRAIALSEEKVKALLCKNTSNPFITSFLTFWVNMWMDEIRSARDNFENAGENRDLALVHTLPDSVFAENIDLYFKLCNEKYSADYITLVKSILPIIPSSEGIPTDLEEEGKTEEWEWELEITALKERIEELAEQAANLQNELKNEQIHHKATQEELASANADNEAISRELTDARARMSAVETVSTQAESELMHYRRLARFVDGDESDNIDNGYEFTSICRVVVDYSGKPWLARLADISKGRISRFVKIDDAPHYFGNRDRLYWKNGPGEDGYIGVWDWNAVPNQSDPNTDYVTTQYNPKSQLIEIVNLPKAHNIEEIATYLSTTGIPWSSGKKVLFSLQNEKGDITGLLCREKDFEINGSIARLKQTVYALPQYTIAVSDVISIGGITLYKSTQLGLPNNIVYLKAPQSLVKEIVVQRATSAVLRQRGLSKKEAQHCQAYLNELPVDTLLQEITEAYGCTKEDAQKFINDFIAQADQYLSEKDIDVAVISAALERNKELLTRCKEILTEEWRAEQAEMLRQTSEQLSAIQSDISASKAALALLSAEREKKSQELDRIRLEYEAQEKLADDVEKKIADRIASARKNAAEFIAEMAFNQIFIPSSVKNNANSELRFSFGNLDCVSHESIEDIDTFEEELAENLEIIGYEETTASEMANIISFCICHNLPVVVGENAEKIADCIAAMFGTQGAYSATVPIGGSSATLCNTMDELVHTGRKVFVLNGIFDGFSVNAFNEIHQRSLEWGNNCVLVLSASGVMPEMIPVSVWNKAFFVDGDVGIIHIQTQKLNSFVSNFSFEKECDVDQIKSHRMAVKSFRGIISNTAMLLYSVFMATYDETIKTSLHLRLQFVLAAGGKTASDEIVEAFTASGITADDNRLIARYL